MKRIVLASLALCSIIPSFLSAQSPGLIVRPAGGNGVTALNPDGNAYSSQSTAGFVSDDIAESEIAFKIVPAIIVEPTGDIATGPTGGFTDIVSRADGSGFYMYKDATNIYFRLRIGGIINGSKGYSILIDTDKKMGGSGPYADPNYVAPAGNSPGNPGFEYEVVLQTNFQVAVYTIDGTATPGAPATYALSTNSQISVALSTDGNNPDYFYDWFVPLTAIGSPASVRISATTVTAPNSAFQGSRSDIYGINDASYANRSGAWQTVINSQPGINLSTFTGINATCTAPPIINTPIAAGSSIAVGGTWMRLDATKPSSATITLFKNGVSAGTTTISSGAAWSITVATIVNGDVFYAMAQSAGESQCLQSASITASACLTPPTAPVLTCGSLKGISGTMPSTASGNTILVYLVPTTVASPTSNLVSTGANLTYPTATSFAYYTNGCSGGSNNVATGVYMVVTQNGSCASAANFVCIATGSSGTPSPLSTNALTFSQPVYPSHTTFNGSGATSGDILRLYINGQYKQSITATGSSFSFTGLTLNTNDQLKVYSQTGTACMTQSNTVTVSCFTPIPVITINTTGNLLTGATTINGTSAYPGASVQVYKGTAPSGVATGSAATVNSGGAWTTTVPALVSGELYYATQTVSGCTSAGSSSVTVFTSAACPTISGTYTDANTTITGTMPSSFTGTIRLYEDGALIGSQSISAATAWSITVPASILYYNGILSATAQATGGAESSGCTTKTVGCTSPLTPSVTPTAPTIMTGQSVNLNVSNVGSGNWYALLDNTGISYATSVYKTNTTNFVIPTNTFNTQGTYNLKLSADALTGCPSSFAALTITVSNTLPVNFLSVNVKKAGIDVMVVYWDVDNEVNVKYYQVERSLDGVRFQAAGVVNYKVPIAGKNSYDFLDKFTAAEKIYYRVKQVDVDGKYMYSKVAVISNEQGDEVSILPNPSVDYTTVAIGVTQNQKATIELIDIKGIRQVIQKVSLSKGLNNIRLNNLALLSRGTYFVKVSTNSGIVYKKLLLL